MAKSYEPSGTYVLQINDSEVAVLTFDEQGYQKAKTLLAQSSVDLRPLSDTGRDRLRNFIKQYQRQNFRA